MKLTIRDKALIDDLALSHVLSRDQLLELGYFGSITRVNTRLRELAREGFIVPLETPFISQRLYGCGKRASDIVSARVSRLISARSVSPRFLQHALAITNVRIALQKRGMAEWWSEQELWRKLGGIEVRPDGLARAQIPIFIEVDMGHVSPAKFQSKLLAYAALATSGECKSLYEFSNFRVLTVTTGPLRANRLRRLLIPDSGFSHLVQTFEEVGAVKVSSWS